MASPAPSHSSLSLFASSSSSSSWEGSVHSIKSSHAKRQTPVRKKQKRKAYNDGKYQNTHRAKRHRPVSNTTFATTADPVKPEGRLCGFCGRGHANGLEFSKGFVDVLTEETVWASEEPFPRSAGAQKVWSYAHTVCVHFSPLTSFDMEERVWRDVTKELNRSRCLTCVICEERGATIGCHVHNCHSSCHFPCGIKDDRRFWSPSQHLTESPFFCPNHQRERRERETTKEIERLRDLSQGREAIPIPLELSTPWSSKNPGDWTCGPSDNDRSCWDWLLPKVPLSRGILEHGRRRSIDFTYVQATVDSKSAQIRRGPEREKRCCKCSGPGACRDADKCECLRDGRNYFRKGRRLDPGHPLQVYECNLNCRCNAVDSGKNTDACRNRLVQRGITCPLVVAYIGLRPDKVPRVCGIWGVIAAEDIPLGSFVCTVAGQLVHARDLVPLEGDGSNITVIESAATGGTRTIRNPHLVHRVRDWEKFPRNTANDVSVTKSHASLLYCSQEPEEVEGGRGQEEGGEFGKGKGKGRGSDGDEVLVDQRHYANISRYIRRALTDSDANLRRVAVHTANQDPKAPVLALFAEQPIPKGRELLLGE